MQRLETTPRSSKRLKAKRQALALPLPHEELNSTSKMMVDAKGMVLEGWNILEHRIDKLHTFLEGPNEKIHLFTPEEYIEVYTYPFFVLSNCYTQQQQRDAPALLYDRYKETIVQYIDSTVRKSITFFERETQPALFDRACEKVYEETKRRVKDVVLVLIDQDREEEHIDRALIKKAVGIFIELSNENHEKKLDLYAEELECSLLHSTSNYYAKKAAKHIDADSCPQYLLMAEKCLIREKEIAASYLQQESEEKLLKIAQKELLSEHSVKLLEKENTGLRVLMRNNEAEHLSRIYRLYSKIDESLMLVAAAFQKVGINLVKIADSHVTEEGLALVKSAAGLASQKEESKEAVSIDQIYARSLIELHDRFMVYVHEYFGSHLLFHNAIREAFLIFCNKDVAGTSSPELLSAYVDCVLRKGGGIEKLRDDAIEGTLDKIVVMLNYLLERDLFAEFCRKKLARRLLFDRSADIEYERSLLSKLKQKWGGQLTSKMEGMVTDLTLAKENQQAFQHYLEACPQENPGMDISLTVLTTGFWPTYKTSDPHLPLEMAATLSLFNESKKLSYQEIMSQLNLSDEDALRVLHSLSCTRYKILKKEPNSKTVSKNDKFEFNEMFTDKMRRIKIPLPPMDEKKKVMADVDKDRRYTIDAAAVRIMKSRRVLNYQQLSSECVQQLSHLFKPDFKLIKKRIEELIQRDYLERDADNPSVLKYIA
ncbi:Cullin-1 [Asimina triloba]